MKDLINYNGMLISYNESQTVGNCIDLGFGTEKTKTILNKMRNNGVDYLSRRSLEKYRNQ